MKLISAWRLLPFIGVLVLWFRSVVVEAAQIPLSSESDESFNEDLKPEGYIRGVRSGTIGVALTVDIKHGVRNYTAPLLGGLLFEDISQSGDGGLYAELLRNRAFQGSNVGFGEVPGIPYRSIIYSQNPQIPFGPTLDGWTGVGDVRLSLDLLHPVSDSLPVALQVDVPLHATGRVGIQNDGFWGISVSPQTYNVSFWAQPSGVRFNSTITHFDVNLESALGYGIWCGTKIPVSDRLAPYAPIEFKGQIECDVTASNINNTFTLTFDAEEARGHTLYFSMFSLFPETYKARSNGLRRDLAQRLLDMNPKFLRFPGGNHLEGYSVQRRWKWWKTIGPLKDRPGRPGDWSYFTTDGLGLLEYLIWCEDFGMVPLLAVYAGFSLDVANYDAGNSTDANEYPPEAMHLALQEALDELEFCMGDPEKTYWGRKRAQYGHPKPFDIPIIQIGNEDFFSHHYPQRAHYMYDGLKKHYPAVEYVFTALDEFDYRIPDSGIWDAHKYAPAGFFIEYFDVWDNFNSIESQRNVYSSLMEYHVSAVGVHGVTNRHPRMGAAVAEAVAAIAGERNPNTYKFSCFAPLIQNLNAWRGTPYNILFTADPNESLMSISYWQQLLFNHYSGYQTLTVSERGGDGFNPLYWVASISEDNMAVYFKIVNAGNTTQILDLQLDIPFKSLNGTILAPPIAGDLYAYNYFGNQTIVPEPISRQDFELFDKDGESMSMSKHGLAREYPSRTMWEVPAFSITVLQFDLAVKGKSSYSSSEAILENDIQQDEL